MNMGTKRRTGIETEEVMQIAKVKTKRTNSVEPLAREVAKSYGVTVNNARHLIWRAIASRVVENEILDQIDFYMTEELGDVDEELTVAEEVVESINRKLGVK